MQSLIEITPIGYVSQARKETIDDYWGDAKATIMLDANRFSPSAIRGLDTFSHIEIIFQFHLVRSKKKEYP